MVIWLRAFLGVQTLSYWPQVRFTARGVCPSVQV